MASERGKEDVVGANLPHVQIGLPMTLNHVYFVYSRKQNDEQEI